MGILTPVTRYKNQRLPIEIISPVVWLYFRIAQMVVKRYLEPIVEKIFHPESCGYRPGKSAIEAVGVGTFTRPCIARDSCHDGRGNLPDFFWR